MAHVEAKTDLSLSEPTLIEGLPGVGLVGKIAADHLVDRLDMTYYAGVYCEGLPSIAVYQADGPTVVPPVRLYASEAHDLLVLQSDVPVSPRDAEGFAACLTGWFAEHDVTPVLLAGRPRENGGNADADGDERADTLYGVATGDGAELLERTSIDGPAEGGFVSGPTGALLARAEETGLTGVGLVVTADGQFPDPEAAKHVLDRGVTSLVDVTVDTASLLEDAQQIRQAREQLARRMQQADQESTQAQPLRMFQ